MTKPLDKIRETFADAKSDGIVFTKKTVTTNFGTAEEIKEALVSTMQGVGAIPEKDFKWLSEYDKIVDWMVDNKGKGLALFGSSGTGKSLIIARLMPLFIRTFMNKIVTPIYPGYYTVMEQGEFEKLMKKPIIIIDELTREEPVNFYGTRLDVIPFLVDHIDRDGGLLLISSNANQEQIIQRYGNHVLDRIVGNCEIVEFKGESLR